MCSWKGAGAGEPEAPMYELRITNYDLENSRADARGCEANAERNFGNNAGY